jgi:serine/threonine protein kinase
MPFQQFIENSGFTSIHPIDEGASADSFRAYDPVLKRNVFIKYYKTCNGADERILSEPRKIAALFSDIGNAADHIASVYSAKEFSHKDDRYIEMITEFCAGNSLYKKIREQDIYILDSLEYAKQIIDGLHVLHKKRFVHRDIKPSNLVISNNKIKIIDLGATAELTQDQNHLVSRSKHTILYRPPEAFDPKNIYGTFSDIYQVGLVLYEMINGAIKESPDNYLVSSILKSKEKRLGKKYSEMFDWERSDIQDISIKFLAENLKLQEKGVIPKRLYNKELKRIIKNLTHPDYRNRVQSCSQARILLSSYSGMNWCESKDGEIKIKNYKGRDFKANEFKDKHGLIKFECLSSQTGDESYRKNKSIENWNAFEKYFKIGA